MKYISRLIKIPRIWMIHIVVVIFVGIGMNLFMLIWHLDLREVRKPSTWVAWGHDTPRIFQKILLAMPWIKTKDRLPDVNTKVLVVYEPYAPGNWYRTMAVYIPPMTVPEENFMAEEYLGCGDYHEEKDIFYTPAGWYESSAVAETNWKIPDPKFWKPVPDLPPLKDLNE